MRPAERVQVLVEAFNDGNIDRVLDGLASDIEVAILIYRLGDVVGPPPWKGEEELGPHLRSRSESGSRVDVVSISENATDAIAIIKSSKQGLLTVTFHFDDEGFASRLVVFKQ